MSNSSKSRTPIAIDQPLPEHLAEKLRQSARTHTARVQKQQQLLGEYPHPDDVEKFDDEADASDIIHIGSNHIRFDKVFEDFRGGRRGRGRQPQGRGGKQGGGKQGGGKNKGGGSGGGKRPLPNPAMVHAEVLQMLQSIPVAGMTGNVQILETNLEFCDKSKAVYFQDSYVELVSRAHVLFLEEVGPAAVAHLGQVTGHAAYASVDNTRGNQAVGFLIHPRMQVIAGPISYTSVANVQGVPDLRPAFRLDLEDTVTGERFSVVVLHLKSMRGGPAVTANIRYRQFQLVVKELGPNFVGIVGGDLNYKIDDPSCREGDPMIQAGYTLLAAGDHSATQIMGSRIDGFFTKGLKVGVDYYKVVAYFLNPNLKRSFTDHGTLKFEVLSATGAKSNEDKKSSGSTGGNGKSGGDNLVGGTNLPPLDKIIIRATDGGRTRKGTRRKTSDDGNTGKATRRRKS